VKFAFCALLAFWGASICAQTSVVVGSKKFTENYVLGEIAAGILVEKGISVQHKQGMGGTIILWEALISGGIDVYPEYTGTISEEILKSKERMGFKQLQDALQSKGIGITGELGFNNTYALVMPRAKASSLSIDSISDLREHPDLRVGVTHEFLNRKDGWKPLALRYLLPSFKVQAIDHTMGYLALGNGDVDIKDAYSTDAKIAQLNLVVLKDDLGFFPQYNAVFLYRLTLPKPAIDALASLEGTLSDTRMTALNAEAEHSKDYTAAASKYLREQLQTKTTQKDGPSTAQKILELTLQHLKLVGLSLGLAVLIGLPLGIWASRGGLSGHLILGTVGVIQTIPSLALLALLVPISFLGISETTAVVALLLYSLLPIVRGTATGIVDIPRPIRESAQALGLTGFDQLRRVYFPMASRSILSGIKVSAVINVGTATLASLIGQGGLGEPIVSGLNLNDPNLILQGAIPAALLAVVVTLVFDGLDRVLIPRGLRMKVLEA